MPHVSKKALDRKTEKELVHSLNIVLTRINKNEDMDSFLLSLLSKTEKLMLAKRLAIIILLKEGIPDSTIAAILHVTRETVNRLQYRMELKGEGYIIALGKLAEQKALEDFKKFLFSLARYSIRAAGGYVKPGVLD